MASAMWHLPNLSALSCWSLLLFWELRGWHLDGICGLLWLPAGFHVSQRWAGCIGACVQDLGCWCVQCVWYGWRHLRGKMAALCGLAACLLGLLCGCCVRHAWLMVGWHLRSRMAGRGLLPAGVHVSQRRAACLQDLGCWCVQCGWYGWRHLRGKMAGLCGLAACLLGVLCGCCARRAWLMVGWHLRRRMAGLRGLLPAGFHVSQRWAGCIGACVQDLGCWCVQCVWYGWRHPGRMAGLCAGILSRLAGCPSCLLGLLRCCCGRRAWFGHLRRRMPRLRAGFHVSERLAECVSARLLCLGC